MSIVLMPTINMATNERHVPCRIRKENREPEDDTRIGQRL
jgi:hypothetical protein